jgi:hypothetical protein
MRTDGSVMEFVPRGMIDGKALVDLHGVRGVAGGFVVFGILNNRRVVFHYDIRDRNCKAHLFGVNRQDKPPHMMCWYLRELHTLVVNEPDGWEGIQLSTGSRDLPPAARILRDRWQLRAFSQIEGTHPLPLQGHGQPDRPDANWWWPTILFDSETGGLSPENVDPPWEAFTPLADGKPLLKGSHLMEANCQGHTLAALFRKEASKTLRLFSHKGVLLTEYDRALPVQRFTLSTDGRLLAWEVPHHRVEVRDVRGGIPLCLTPTGRYHNQVHVELGQCWLTLRIDKIMHLVRWQKGVLEQDLFYSSNQDQLQELLAEKGYSNRVVRAVPPRLPYWAAYDRQRFLAAAQSNLHAVVDCLGQVILSEANGRPVVSLFAFRRQLALRTPDGVCMGPEALLGQPATPDAARKIGMALLNAWQRGSEATP